jgi:hypothetical protein
MNKQTVYLPLKIENPTDKSFDVREGYFFTAEELNEYTQNVIKQALETAAEKATVTPIDHEEISEGSFRPIWGVDDDSITNTFEETYKKFEV